MDYIEQILWDLDDDPLGNVQHLAEHDVSKEEFEEVLQDPRTEFTYSDSSGNPIGFGWTASGRYLAIVFIEENDDPRIVRPVTAYDTEPPERKGGRRRKGR